MITDQSSDVEDKRLEKDYLKAKELLGNDYPFITMTLNELFHRNASLKEEFEKMETERNHYQKKCELYYDAVRLILKALEKLP